MALKQKNSDPSVPERNDSQGAWGIIAPASAHLDAIRFSREPEEIVSYAYRAIIRWHWKPGPPETVEITAGADTITITGHGLQRFMDALDDMRLQKVCQQGAAEGMPEILPYVISINIKEAGK